MRIGWFTLTRDVKTASARYRCFHMAWALQAEGVESVVYVKPSLLIADLAALDAVIIVKRLDQRAEDVARAAAAAGKPVFLDLCDDLLNPAQGPDRSRLHRATLETIAPLLAAVVTTNEAFSHQLRAYGVPLPSVVEIPDLAETKAIFEAVGQAAAVMPERASSPSPPPILLPLEARKSRETAPNLLFRLLARAPVKKTRRIVWFGNHGGPHSNFGILSLLSVAPALRSAAERFPVELVVVSNHAGKYEAFIPRIGIPSRYVAWSAEAVYDELHGADVALLTNGDDEFSAVKSANRPLQALACGVPALTNGNQATRALGDAVVIDDFTAGLDLYLSDPRAASAAVRAGQALIDAQFSPSANAQAWRRLLETKRSPLPTADSAAPPAPATQGGRLFLVAGPEIPPAMAQAIRSARGQAMVLVTPEAGSDGVAEFLIAERLIPVMTEAGEIRPDDARWLRGAREVIITEAEKNTPAAHDLRALANAFAIPISGV